MSQWSEAKLSLSVILDKPGRESHFNPHHSQFKATHASGRGIFAVTSRDEIRIYSDLFSTAVSCIFTDNDVDALCIVDWKRASHPLTPSEMCLVTLHSRNIFRIWDVYDGCLIAGDLNRGLLVCWLHLH